MTLTQINRAGLDADALDRVFTIGASGSSAYTFQGEGLNGTVNNPTLYLTRGKTYRFENGSGGHPIRIQSTSGASGTAYNTGVTNNAGSGTVIVEVQHDAPDVLYYQCTSHAAMNGILYITGALSDGGVTTAKIATDAVTADKIADGAVTSAHIAADTIVSGDIATGAVGATELADNAVDTAALQTNAVTTAKIADDAVTNAKIANDAVDTAQIATNSVTTLKLVDEAVTLAKLEHGTSSNDGKFLRANNGADPTFETVSVTPSFGSQNISTTGSLSSGDITINSTAPKITFTDSNDNPDYLVQINAGGFLIHDSTNTADRIKIDSSGRVGIGTTNPTGSNALFGGTQNTLMVAGSAAPQLRIQSSISGQSDLILQAGNSAADAYIANAASNGDIVFSTNNGSSQGTRLRILDDGGICFNSDTAAANALDDYEEGTHTLGYNANVSLSSNYNIGEYTKIGNLVTFNFLFYVTGVHSLNTVYVTLPFQAKNGSGSSRNDAVGSVMHNQVNAGSAGLVPFIGQNSSTVSFYRLQENGGWSVLNNGHLNSGDEMYVSVVYRAA